MKSKKYREMPEFETIQAAIEGDVEAINQIHSYFQPFINSECKREHLSLIHILKGKGEELKTTKADTDNHGIGLASVRRAVGKYHGTVSIDHTVPGRFVIRTVLYGA